MSKQSDRVKKLFPKKETKKGFDAPAVKNRDKPKEQTGKRSRGQSSEFRKDRKFKSTGKPSLQVGGRTVSKSEFREFKRREGSTRQTTEDLPTENGTEEKKNIKDLFKEGTGKEVPTGEFNEENAGVVQSAEEIQAGVDGRVPFNELPAYQQILAGIATAGGAGLSRSAGRGLSKVGVEGRAVIEANRANERAKRLSIAKIAKLSGKSEEKIANMVSTMTARTSIAEVFGTTSGKTLGLGVKGKIGLGVGTVGVSALGADAYLFQWYALDNVLGGIKINSNQVLSSYRFNGGDATEIISAMEESLDIAKATQSKIEFSNKYNPLLYPHKKLISAGAAEDIRVIEDNLRQMKELSGISTPEEIIEETQSL